MIVWCGGPLDVTRRCIMALARRTRRPWELVALDAGSTGVAAYLVGVGDVAPFRVEVIGRPAAGDFPGRCRPGLGAALGHRVVLLADDAVVTDGWLDQLVALASSDPAIGMAAPVSNTAPPPQRSEPVYGDEEGLRRFAASWRDGHRGEWFTSDTLGALACWSPAGPWTRSGPSPRRTSSKTWPCASGVPGT